MTLTAPQLDPVRDAFLAIGDSDPTYSAQLAIYYRGSPILDLTVGTGLTEDALLPVFSSSKGAIGLVIALLVERRALDLDATVASYWPEFGRADKDRVTVRQLLSHQGGLVGVDGGYTDAELLAHEPLAERLASQRPLWHPGRAFSYHALTIGTLADELVRRIDGRPLGTVFADDIAGPRDIDVHLGAGPDLDPRVADVALPTDAELTEWAERLPVPEPDGLSAMASPRSDKLLYLRVNDEDFRRVGPPAAGGLATARGLARMYACLHHDLGGDGRLLSPDTIDQVSQVQVAGTDLGSGLEARFGIVFQTPNPPRLPFGSARAFGHDGAGGSLAFCDPLYDLSFGYLTQRIPLPGGADARAIGLTRILREYLRPT